MLLGAKKNGRMFAFKCGRNSMVECQLPKLKVASSILVARSKKKSGTGNRSIDGDITDSSQKLRLVEKRNLKKVGNVTYT